MGQLQNEPKRTQIHEQKNEKEYCKDKGKNNIEE